jgi:hypothetical protein
MKLVWPALVVLAACGGSGSPQSADAPVSIDSPGIDAPFAEAAHIDPPQVVSTGGPVMTSVQIVPIFFAGDSAMQTQVEGFLTALVGSAWWSATTSEYGVGALSVHTTIVSNDTPPTTDDALKAWLASHVGATTWPAPDGNTIFAVFLPTGVSLSTPFGNSCTDFGAYHDEGMTSGSTKFIYALMPRCDATLDSLSVASSHEFVEAATDPFPFTNGAYQSTDDADLIWSFTPGGELGDMCEYVAAAPQRLVGSYAVQRTWSNASAKAGHDPCVPVMPTAYLASAPVFTENLMLDPGDGTGPHMTKGVQVATGTSKTIEVDLFSDAPAADWTVKAIDAAAITGSATELTFSWDQTTGHNGDKRQLTITRMQDGANGGSEFVISTRVNGHSVSLWWGFVAN